MMTKTKRKTQSACKSCNEQRTSFRRRGLCFKCYRKPRIRERHAAYVKTPDFYGDARKPRRPIRFVPGDPRKVLELCKRAASGQQLFVSGYDRVRKVNLN